jgi:hypothetical protein
MNWKSCTKRRRKVSMGRDDDNHMVWERLWSKNVISA